MRKFLLCLPVATVLATSFPANAGPLSLVRLRDTTGINLSESQVTSIWNALNSMGTTEFLGGNLGSFRLDESSMIAGAATLGASEFDNFLRTGNLSGSNSSLGGLLTQRMTSSAGLDLSYLTGSFTSGGGVAGGTTSFANLTSLGGASAASPSCDPEISSKLAEIGEQHVNGIVTAAMSKEYGFSQISDLRGADGTGSGFSALGCLDRLFQGTGVDILFKPPSLGNLSNMLQNWTCGEAVGVAQQVAGAFGSGEIFKTAGLGGFYPALTMGEAMDGAVSKRPGIGQSARDTFGFGDFGAPSASQIARSASLGTLFR